MEQYKIEKIIDSIDKLPALPIIYTRLSNLLARPNSTIRMIANVIAEDQTIAAKVLKLVNSAFYGFPKKIASLQRAVVILGLMEIKNLVLATSIWKTFDHFKSGDGLSMKSFWQHSVACALSAKVLAEAAYLKNPESVFTGGLLHDIGKLIHAIYLPQEFSNVISDIEATGSPMVEVEKKILGLNHTETGRMLAERWGFPEETVNIIAKHHVGDDCFGLTKEIAAVHIGNILCIAFGLGSGGERRVPEVNPEAWKILGLRISDLESVSTRINRLFGEATIILES